MKNTLITGIQALLLLLSMQAPSLAIEVNGSCIDNYINHVILEAREISAIGSTFTITKISPLGVQLVLAACLENYQAINDDELRVDLPYPTIQFASDLKNALWEMVGLINEDYEILSNDRRQFNS